MICLLYNNHINIGRPYVPTENGLYSLSCCGSFTCWGSFTCCAYKCRAPPLDIDREDVEEGDVGGEADNVADNCGGEGQPYQREGQPYQREGLWILEAAGLL